MDSNKYDIIVINKVLLELVKKGLVVCNCYKCNLPMSFDEALNSKCSSCGKLEFDRVLFRAFSQEDLS